MRSARRGRVWIVAGTGTNNTADSIALTRMAEELGMDGAMIVTPFYNKPTPKGQAAHFTAVAKSTKLPLILYNVPGRTGTNTTPDVLAMVHDLPNVKAVKEASGNLDQMSQVKTRTTLTLLSGDDGADAAVRGRRRRGHRLGGGPGGCRKRDARAVRRCARGHAGRGACASHQKLHAAVQGGCSSSRTPGRSSSCCPRWG